MLRFITALILSIIISTYCSAQLEDTFDSLTVNTVPQNFEELWRDYDPSLEPLDIDTLYEWEQEDVIMQVIRFRVAVFGEEKAMLAAIYGYPKGGTSLPGLVQIHGGGQYAHFGAVLANAKRGYATVSIAWAGRIIAPNYIVTPDIIQLFWDDKTNDPNYKVTTDWGPLDGYHAPSKAPGHWEGILAPEDYTLDHIESPRNSSWFLWTLGARRALTFLENQPEVNGDKLGIYGHSMGGKISILSAFDNRVKAVAPSCGGISDNLNFNPLFQRTMSDTVYLNQITCPIMLQKPSNDFNARIEDLAPAVGLLKTDDWRVSTSPHHNHQDLGETEVTAMLWMDQYLKGTFTYPQRPEVVLNINTASKTPTFTVTPDPGVEPLEVDVYYTHQGELPAGVFIIDHLINRFWHYSKTTQNGDVWEANLPLAHSDQPLWCYVNIKYALNEPISGSGYYYQPYTTDKYNISSLVQVASKEDLQSAGVEITKMPTTLIEDFDDNWEKEWFAYAPLRWELRTHKIYSDIYKAPATPTKLSLRVRCEEDNILVIGLGSSASEVQVEGGNEWRSVILSEDDFLNPLDEPLNSWDDLGELRISANDVLIAVIQGVVHIKNVGTTWTGALPELQDLRWEDLSSTNSVEEPSLNLNIFPNPSHGIVQVFSNEESWADLEIINTSGQVVLTKKINLAKDAIDISHMINGTYFLKIIIDGQVTTRKIIKE